MTPRRRRSPARLLAPIALIACAVAVFLVVSGTRSSDGGDGNGASAGGQRTTTTETAPRKLRASYTVKTGDTLGGIAEKTGLTVDRLQELNPELDPQALVSGQKIKLRE